MLPTVQSNVDKLFESSPWGGKRIEPRLVPAYKFDVMITTYEMVIADSAILSPIQWSSIIVDEVRTTACAVD